MPPTGGTSWIHGVGISSVGKQFLYKNSTPVEHGDIAAGLLFIQLLTFVISLQKQNRQTCPEFLGLLTRLRVGVCTALYYQNLLKRVKDVLQLPLGDYKSIIRKNDQRQYVGDSPVAYVARASGRRVIIASSYD